MTIRVRLRFARRYAGWHLLVSCLVAFASAGLVFGLWYPAYFRQLLQVDSIYLLVLAVDVCCGPLLTLILASPKKSVRERWLDLSLVGLIQIIALAYGLHSVWLARPAVLAFERDRLVLVTANELDRAALPKAPPDLRELPLWGVLHVATRRPRNNTEFFENAGLGAPGASPATRPDWWLPWDDAREEMNQRARPLAELIARRPEQTATLEAAARSSGLRVDQLRYLPLTSHKTREWVMLLDPALHMVGHAPVDGF